MKKVFAFLLALMLVCGVCCADGMLMGHRQERIYQTIKYCMDVPKDAQLISAMEYACNPGEQVHMLLICVTQKREIEDLNGSMSRIIAVDLDRDFVYTYKNLNMPDQPDAENPVHLRAMIINSYDAYLQGINEYIWMDSEIKFELSDAEIAQINAQLYSDFMPPAQEE